MTGDRRPRRRPAARPAPGPRQQRRAALARRRARVALAVAAAFCVVVLATSLPLRTLLQQRTDTAATAATVRHLTAENRALAAQAAALSNPATVRSLAHTEFDYVQPGQKTYDVLPPSDGSSGEPGVGQEQLGTPVPLPGSAASDEAVGAGALPSSSGGSAAATAGDRASGSSPSAPGGSAGSGSGGFLDRMLHALEFWS